MKFIFPLLVISLSLSSCTLPAQEMPATLILVRHAQKATEPKDDPPLTEAGKQRAEQLNLLLSQERIDAIYATPYRRTMETVTPLSEQKGVEITSYDPREAPGEFLGELVRKHAGGVVVISGHSNTIPVMLNYLSGSQDYEQLDESDYNDVYVVSAGPERPARVLHFTYQPLPEN